MMRHVIYHVKGPGAEARWTAIGWQSGDQAKVQRQGAGAPKDRQDRVHAFALPDASSYDQPSEPPTGIQPGILAVLFASSRLGVAALVIHPIALTVIMIKARNGFLEAIEAFLE
jgi:hypothetical protein